MTDKIEPALSAEEWAEGEYSDDEGSVSLGLHYVMTPWCNDESHNYFKGRGLPALIALANSALPDSDPRKITREKLALLDNAFDHWERETVGLRPDADHQLLRQFVDALESYLPPDPT